MYTPGEKLLVYIPAEAERTRKADSRLGWQTSFASFKSEILAVIHMPSGFLKQMMKSLYALMTDRMICLQTNRATAKIRLELVNRKRVVF